MSDLGYRNKTQGRLGISANSLAEYVGGLTEAMTTVEPRYAEIGVVVDGEYRQLNANLLQIENEYYSSIRPKPSKASSSRPAAALRAHGIEYVEVRTLDLSPRDPVGINQNQLRFIETLLLYCLLADSPPIDAAEQAEIDARDLTVARDGRRPGRAIVQGGKERPLADVGLEIVARLDGIAALLDADREGYVAALEVARETLHDPDRTPAACLLRDLAAERATFFEYGVALARDHAQYFAKLAAAPAREQALAETASRSLAEAAVLERSETRPFADYLRDYLAAV
jgi:glutamate--cysteine ligase